MQLNKGFPKQSRYVNMIFSTCELRGFSRMPLGASFSEITRGLFAKLGKMFITGGEEII